MFEYKNKVNSPFLGHQITFPEHKNERYEISDIRNYYECCRNECRTS